MRITAVTCVKNEGPFLLEWIAFNRVIGVTDFVFFSNDCTDGTDHLLDRLAQHGVVGHLDNPADPEETRNYQMKALQRARLHPALQNADWIWIADVDEFLNIHAGDNRIADLIRACGDPHAISVSFQFFANGGQEQFEDRPVIEQFTWSHDPDIWNAQTAIEVKSLIRKDFPLDYIGAHRPFPLRGASDLAQIAWTDGAGRPVPESFRNHSSKRRIRAFPAKGARRFATLNHYALRSLDSYLVKVDRGDVNRENRAFDCTYWRERNDSAHHDRSILRYMGPVRQEISRLMDLDGIAQLHADAVAWHRARCDALLAQQEYAELRHQLRHAPPLPPDEDDLLQELGLGRSALYNSSPSRSMPDGTA